MADAQHEQNLSESNAAKLKLVGRISLIVDVLLISGCAYLLADDILEVLGGKPEFATRGGAFLVNLSATFALVYRFMVLIQRFWPTPFTGTGVVVLKGLVAVLIPLFVALRIEMLVYGGHRAQLDALAAEISTRTASAIATNGSVRAPDLLTLGGPYLQQLTVRVDTGAFLLSARMPGFDSEGYAARYSSGEGVWHLDPYASSPQTSPAFDANGQLLLCRLQDNSFNCERRER